MKGIVLEIKKNRAIVLTKTGQFENIPAQDNYEEGMKIDFYEPESHSMSDVWKNITSIAAAVIIVFILGTGVYAWFMPYQYINIDINPSLELIGNRFDRIIKVKGINSDGQNVAKDLKVYSLPIEKGLDEVIHLAEEKGFIKEGASDVLISVTALKKDESEKICSKLKKHLERMNKNKNNVQVLSFNKEAYELAKKKGISPGKMKLIKKAVEENSGLKEEQLFNLPIKDIVEKVHSKKRKGDVLKSDEKNNVKKDTSNKNDDIEETSEKEKNIPINKKDKLLNDKGNKYEYGKQEGSMGADNSYNSKNRRPEKKKKEK